MTGPAPTPDAVPVTVARRRWLALVGVRVAGVGGAIFGLVIAARAHDTVPKLLGIAIVVAALAMIAIVPASLAHRWRSPDA